MIEGSRKLVIVCHECKKQFSGSNVENLKSCPYCKSNNIKKKPYIIRKQTNGS